MGLGVISCVVTASEVPTSVQLALAAGVRSRVVTARSTARSVGPPFQFPLATCLRSGIIYPGTTARFVDAVNKGTIAAGVKPGVIGLSPTTLSAPTPHQGPTATRVPLGTVRLLLTALQLPPHTDLPITTRVRSPIIPQIRATGLVPPPHHPIPTAGLGPGVKGCSGRIRHAPTTLQPRPLEHPAPTTQSSALVVGASPTTASVGTWNHPTIAAGLGHGLIDVFSPTAHGGLARDEPPPAARVGGGVVGPGPAAPPPSPAHHPPATTRVRPGVEATPPAHLRLCGGEIIGRFSGSARSDANVLQIPARWP